jgi:hypothetical protein
MKNDQRPVMSCKWVLVVPVLLLASCASGSQPGLGAYPKAVGAADEGFAIQALRTIATAQAQFKVTRGSYGDFNALTQAGFLDERFAAASPVTKGYRLTISAADNEFSVNADPDTSSQGTTGSRHFYLDSSDNSIHVNVTQPAGKTDPKL